MRYATLTPLLLLLSAFPAWAESPPEPAPVSDAEAREVFRLQRNAEAVLRSFIEAKARVESAPAEYKKIDLALKSFLAKIYETRGGAVGYTLTQDLQWEATPAQAPPLAQPGAESTQVDPEASAADASPSSGSVAVPDRP